MYIYKAPEYTKEMLFQMDDKDIVFPFTNREGEIGGVYDGLFHQYRLNPEYFTFRGHNLEKEIEGNDANRVKNFLDYLRIKSYGWIYSASKSSRSQINYMIAKGRLLGFTPFEYRTQFLEAMFLQGEYMLANGDIAAISGVDLDTMQNMSADVIRWQDRDMHPNAMKARLELLRTLSVQTDWKGLVRCI